MEAIRIEKLTKRYGTLTAVSELELIIHGGETFGLLGVNGAGKTTTVKMLSCLTRPDSGDAYLNGKSIVSESAEVKSIIGVSPQETAVAPNLSVRENLEFMCGVFGFSKDKTRSKTEELIVSFDLGSVADRKAGKLFGGWQRRLSIALALVGEPEILFLDEPTLGLDVIARSELHDFIRSLPEEVTVVLTTHYMEEAEALCDRIGIMKEGRLIALGTVPELCALAGKDGFEAAFVALVKGEKQ